MKMTSLEHEVEEYRDYAAWLPVAKQLAEEAERLVAAKYPSDGSNPTPESFGYEFEDIGELAYRNIRSKLISDAMNELTARHEKEHRAHLYERLLEELEHEKGKDIALEVRQKIETDPELAVELRDSARKELGSRAMGAVTTEISAKQQKIVEEEAGRQLSLDRLDVKFAYDGELDLVGDELFELLEPGDKLKVFHDEDKERYNPIEFTWTRDAKGKEGWIFTAARGNKVVTKNSGDWEVYRPDDDRFVTIGVINKDRETGKEVIQPNKLVAGLPLVLVSASGKNTIPKIGDRSTFGSYRDYYTNIRPLLVSSIDLETKTLVFTKS